MPPHFINNYMWFNFFKHKEKKKEVPPKTFEGRFISEEEIDEMIRPKQESFIKKELREINEMMQELKNQIEKDGRE